MSDENEHLTGVGLEHWKDSFPATRWSILLEEDDTGATQRFLAKISHHYWYPMYAFLRKRGHASQDAQDLTQGFLCKMMENNGLDGAAPNKGRFRSYLLTALKHYENDIRKTRKQLSAR